jgi:GTP-binding protein YchF
MSLSVGIVGLPNVGKSTLFNALTKSSTALAENYPFATIDPNVGIVSLKDNRLNTLAKMFNSKKIVNAFIKFVDIAGIVKGASKGEGLGNKFLANIRECELICQVVRAFENDNITHVNGTIDPKRDIDIINTELILADLSTVENAISRYKKELSGKKIEKSVLDEALKVRELLNNGEVIYKHGEFNKIKELGLLTQKKQIIVFNIATETFKDKNKLQELKQLANNDNVIFINAYLESELFDLSDADAKELLVSETGSEISGLDNLAKISFDALNLQTFFTAGEIESKAWQIKKGSTAPEAAGVIHTDFQKGFIKAQVVSYADLISATSLKNAWDKGLVRIEGKDYIVKDSDIIEFKFNKT